MINQLVKASTHPTARILTILVVQDRRMPATGTHPGGPRQENDSHRNTSWWSKTGECQPQEHILVVQDRRMIATGTHPGGPRQENASLRNTSWWSKTGEC